MTATQQEDSKVVVVDYQALTKDPSPENSLSSQLEQAYGSSGSLGVLAIRNVPGFVSAKNAFLPMAHTLAHLPKEYLEEHLTDASTLYNAGWSHGKEKLGDKPDWAKGSFYFNPLTDQPGSEQDRAKYPVSYPCNLWPDRIPGFEENAKRLGTLMKDVVVHLAKHLDAFALEKNPEYPANSLFNAMESTEKAKGRLLYYFPLPQDESPSEDSWIGWHNDSGFLTALAGDMYVNDETGEEIPPPDPDAGLYVVDRQDNVVHVSIPEDCMAVQMGECVQILTGGTVVATPHCVRGAKSSGNLPVARISLPCFIDTPPNVPLCMPRGCTREQVLSAGVGSSRVPPLSARWAQGMPFGDFLQKTFSLYYDWSCGNDKAES
jgi:isopenicillin N synthase-like dioxygenase